jgi:hypothetical protein
MREGVGNLSQAQMLIAIADSAEVFRVTDGDRAYATVDVTGHHETWPVRSRGFREWLVRNFYEIQRKPPNQQAQVDALGAIEARARFGGRAHPVAVRVAELEGAIYLDLANKKWEAVQVTPDRWQIVQNPLVKFRRPRGMLPLPRPEIGGSLAELRPFVNVEGESQWPLLAAWLVATLRPTGPYPVLTLSGEHGTAKSTTAEVLRALIDPNAAGLRAEPSDQRDVMIAATNGWCMAFDNLSHLAPWFSDCLCRLATGGGFATRELYTDAEETIFTAQRPVILNGIEEIITRPDLLDRAVIIDLPRIDESRRRTRADFWRDFEAARPRILGALLDAVAVALRRSPGLSLPLLPRMADFAVWATAAEPALGLAQGAFLVAYDRNRAAAHELVLEASHIASLLRGLAEEGDWNGTVTELLEVLEKRVDDVVRRQSTWPKNGRALSGTLRRLAPNLRAVGVEIASHDRPSLGRRRRQWLLKKTPGGDRSNRSHLPREDNQSGRPNGANDEPGMVSVPEEEEIDL